MIKGTVEGTLPEIQDDMTTVMADVEGMLWASVMENFARGGRPTWRPLKKGGPSFLTESGRLRGSIRSGHGSDFAEVYISKSSVPYAFIHQFGGYAGKNHKAYIPPRPYMMLTDDDKEWILKALQEDVLKLITTQKQKQQIGKK